MMELYRNGKVRAIGISNFIPHHMEALLDADIQADGSYQEYEETV